MKYSFKDLKIQKIAAEPHLSWTETFSKIIFNYLIIKQAGVKN